MESTHGAAVTGLNQAGAAIKEYTLVQTIYWVMARLSETHPTLDDDTLYELLEFQANPSFGFPTRDVESVCFFEQTGGLRVSLTLNLLALTGASSPLPSFYIEQLQGDGESAKTLRGFLDLFHHRLQRLMWPFWKKYRYHSRFERGAKDDFSEQLFALIGLAGADIRRAGELSWKRLLPYLGLLSQQVHSAALIEAVLRYYFKHAELDIEQCVERRVNLAEDQRNALSLANSMPGMNLVLGEQVTDRAGKFRLHIRGLDWKGFHDFLRNGIHYPVLNALLRFTLRDPLDYDVRLVLLSDQIHELRLGSANVCQLGWSSWLDPQQADGVAVVGKNYLM